MIWDRRRFLAGLAATGLYTATVQGQSRRRVVVAGGGWGGLAAARYLRQMAPELDVVLLERNERFHSLPLSNKWLVGLADARGLTHDYAAAARRFGYTFVRTEVSAVDRQKRRVATAAGDFDYDWLVLAAGIRHDYAAWFGDDHAATEHARRHYDCAYTAGTGLEALKRRLERFAGGDLLMTIPPAPYRCPPAPYERALMIGWLLKTRRIKGRLIVLDPNRSYQGFNRLFADEYKDQIVYVADAAIRRVDPITRRIETDFDEYRFDDAMLMPPQQAADIVWQAGLIGRNSSGVPNGWAEVDPLHWHAVGDERVFPVGDLVGPVSPLFGHLPKTGQMAVRMGRIVAGEIAARAAGTRPARQLPDSTCHVVTHLDPEESMRIESSFRVRGDGLLMQTTRQTRDAQPRGEDVAWAQAMFAEFLAPAD